jgi:transcriptional regulator with XRE-family HTH domain
MRPSSLRTTTAVLRHILGIKDFEMAEILDRSKYTIHEIESGRLKLSHELATKIFHETGVSLDWLLNGDPAAPPITNRGEPYTKEIFEKAQAEKIYYDRPHPFFQKTDALQCCARLAGILKSASDGAQYFMAKYKLGGVLGALEKQFGGEQTTDPKKWIDLLKPLVAHGEGLISGKALKEISSPRRSKRPSKRRHRR